MAKVLVTVRLIDSNSDRMVDWRGVFAVTEGAANTRFLAGRIAEILLRELRRRGLIANPEEFVPER